MTEQALSRQVEAELELFSYPVRDWVRPVRRSDGTPVHNVVIVGGGQAGLAIAFGLRQEHISGVMVLDENPGGMEGPWVTYARMLTLRTLKFLTGPDLGVPSLTFRRWHGAVYGEDAWDGLVRIDKADWMQYLVWFRETLDIPVRNNVRLTRIEPSGVLWALHLATPDGPEVAPDARDRSGHRPGRRWHKARPGFRPAMACRARFGRIPRTRSISRGCAAGVSR